MSRQTRVLLTTPNLKSAGGVAHYYQVLQPHFRPGIEYLTVGTRGHRESGVHCGYRMLRDYLNFYRRLKSGRYDLVHLNPSLGRKALVRDGLLLLIAKALGRKVLVFVRGWDPACELSLRRWFLPLFRQVYFRADAFIVLASQFESALREMGYDKPIYRETTAVSDEVFGLAEAQAAGQAPRDHLNILFLSRIEKAKGIYEAIEALRILRETYPSVIMTVAGDGSELEAVKEYVRSRGVEGVAFLGWVQGRAKLEALINADLYLFPTHHGEGMPNSVLEAMARGLPVVTRLVGGVCDFFEDGKMGFAMDSSSPQDIADLVERLLLSSELRAEMGRYNRHYANRHFAAAVVADRLSEIYLRTTCPVRIEPCLEK